MLRRIFRLFIDLKEFIRFYLNGGADIIFFCIAPVDRIWIESTYREANKRGLKTALIISNASEKESRSNIFYGSLLLLKFVSCKLLVTASNGIENKWKPRNTKYMIHMPHSFVSLHAIYPKDSFDSFNLIFACGPHHTQEVEELNKFRHIKNRATKKIGYGKFDLLNQEFAKFQTQPQKNITVLIAPSWGEDNILDSVGGELIEHLIAEDYKVIIRPHPSFFNDDNLTLKRLKHNFADQIIIENSAITNESIFTADIMISDYSGVSFEYAILRKKPVLFINVAKKILNSDWQQIEAPPIEIFKRTEIGHVVEPNIAEVKLALQKLLESQEEYSRKITQFTKNYVYNYSACSGAAVDELQNLLSEK